MITADAFVVGETEKGRRLHAVPRAGAVDATWREALCGAKVIVYSRVSFHDRAGFASCAKCRRIVEATQ